MPYAPEEWKIPPESEALVAHFCELLRRDVAARGHLRMPPGAREIAQVFDTMFGQAVPELQTVAGRALMRVTAIRLSEIISDMWDRAYALGRDVEKSGTPVGGERLTP
jgi:hypothetical protein